MPKHEKPLIWMGSSKRDLMGFSEEVKDVFGFALHLAQHGEKHLDAKPLKGFAGAKTLEIVEDYQRDTYRAVYTLKLEGYVYVVHCFQKKSKKGIATPKPDIELIKARLKDAEKLHAELKR
jgi:phage-related protein